MSAVQFTPVSTTFRKFTLALLLSGLTGGLFAVEKAQPSPSPTVIPRALPVEKEKKPGFFERIFQKKTPTPAPAPPPTPTPKAKPKPKVVKKRVKAKSTPTARVEIDPANPGLVPLPDSPTPDSPTPDITSASPDSTPLPAALPPLVGGSVNNSESETQDAPPVAPVVAMIAPEAIPEAIPDSTPLPPEVRNNPMNQPIALIDDSQPLVITPEPITPEDNIEKTTVERIQFRKLKAKALEDTKLQALKQKTELAATPAARYAALKEYYPKLFASMRKIDETLSMQIDEMEAASRRRLERMEADELENSPPAQ